MDKSLINKIPQTDFEKLLFANSYIKLLKKEKDSLRQEIKGLNNEIGILKSEVDEWKYKANLTPPNSEKLRKIKKRYKELRLEFSALKRRLNDNIDKDFQISDLKKKLKESSGNND